MKKNKDELAQYTAELEAQFQRWEKLYNYGGSDPFWPDGMGLYLTRNHIIYSKKKIEELIKREEGQPSLFKTKFPEIYYKETPPEMDTNYMAIPNKILDKGITLVNKLEANPTFNFILEHIPEIFPQEKETPISKYLDIPAIPTMQLTHYRQYIESGNLVDIRRMFYYMDLEEKLQEIDKTAEKIRRFLELSPEEIEQINNKKRKSFDLYKSDEEDFDIIDEDLTDSLTEEGENSKPSIDNIIDSAKQRNSLINDHNFLNEHISEEKLIK